MASKRKIEMTLVDENERALYTMFRNMANHLSHFYAESISQQKSAFAAGQNYAILKLHDWIVEKLQEGKMLTIPEVLGYLQARLSDGASASQTMEASSSAPQDPDRDRDPPMPMD